MTKQQHTPMQYAWPYQESGLAVTIQYRIPADAYYARRAIHKGADEDCVGPPVAGYYAMDNDGNTLFSGKSPEEIVRAVNSHADLVAALEFAQKFINMRAKQTGVAVPSQMANAISAALAKAKGEA